MKQELNHFHFIDGLRAIAVLAVLLFHISPSFAPGGYLGVDVFFVLSGFVVTYSVVNFHGSFKSFLYWFYSRRALRLFPSLAVVLTITSIFTVLFVPPAWLSSSNEESAKMAHLGLMNWHLISAATDYFSPLSEFNPFTHCWSLGVEEQFYLIFPWFIFPLYLRWGSIKVLQAVLILLIGISFWINFKFPISDPWTFYSLPARAWQLGLGVMTFLLVFKFFNKYPAKKRFAVLGFFALTILFLIFFSPESSSPNLKLATVISLGTAIVLVLGVVTDQKQSLINQALSFPFLLWVGRHSYTLYLTHWPIVVIAKWTVGMETLTVKLAVILFSFLSSILLTEFVEKRFRANRVAPWILKYGLLFGLSALALSYVFSTTMFRNQRVISLTSVAQKPHLWDVNHVDPDDCNPKRSDLPGHQILITPEESCLTGDQNKATLFVVGDSHAGAYIPMFRQVSRQKGLKIHIFSMAGCTPLAVINSISARPECEQFFENARLEISKIKKPEDVIFLPGLRTHRLGKHFERAHEETYALMGSVEVLNAIKNFELNIEKEMGWISSLELRVIIEAPKPLLIAPPFRCVDWFNRMNPLCEGVFEINREKMIKFREPVMNTLNKIVALNSQISIFDPLKVFCPDKGETCAGSGVEGSYFYDGDHLSKIGSEKVTTAFVQFLDESRP